MLVAISRLIINDTLTTPILLVHQMSRHVLFA